MNIDILTCYVLAGTGALLGLGLMSVIQSDQPHISISLRIFRWGLASLSVSSLIVAVPEPWLPDVLKVIVGFVGVGVSFLFWAFRELHGQVTKPSVGITLAALSGGALWTSAAFFSDTQFLYTVGTVFAFLSVATAVDQGLLIIQKQRTHSNEIGLILLAIVFAFLSVSLLVHVTTHPGPYPNDWFYYPSWLRPLAGLILALLPMAVAALVFSVINERLNHKLRHRVLSDELTGCLSRRGLRELGERMVSNQSSNPAQLAVLMVDLDHFKAVNDRYGHSIGDQVLCHISNLMRMHLRKDALLARYGGEEFSILLPVQNQEEAQNIAERLRQTVEANPCETKFGKISCTVSIGVSFHKEDSSLEEDLAKADTRLYAAKKSGRNKVDCTSDENWALSVM